MPLKDIKNDPNISSDLRASLGTSKQPKKDPECKAITRLKAAGQHLGLNTCSDYKISLNTCMPPVESNTEGLIQTTVETVPPKGASESVMPYSPENHSLSKLSFFTDPTTSRETEGHDMTFDCTNKYFSTPLPSSGRARKKLSPVMEVDVESSTQQEMEVKESTADVMNGQQDGGALSSESPTPALLYRSFFGLECLEIANKLKGSESKKSPEKRKADDMDVSAIDAEPPPNDFASFTPMKSMLANEISSDDISMANSPVKDVSLGVGLLDLEKMEMEVCSFDFSLCANKSSRGQFLNDSLREPYSGKRAGSPCAIKRQKMDPLSCDKDEALELDSVHLSPSNLSSFCVTREKIKSPNENLTFKGEHSPSTSITKKLLAYSEADALSVETDVNKKCSSTTQEIDDPLFTNITWEAPTNLSYHIRLTPKSSLSPSATQDIAVTYNESPRGNTTQVLAEPSSVFANVTQDIVLANEVSAANKTEVLGLFSPSFANKTQEICVVPNVCIANVTQVLGTSISSSANTTQDIAVVHYGASTANTTQELGAPSSAVANITQDNASLYDGAIATSTTHVVAPILVSANTSQDIAAMYNEVPTANTTQTLEFSYLSSNRTQEIAELQEVCTSNINQVLGESTSSSNTTQDIAVMNNGASNTIQALEAPTSASANTTQDTAVVHESCTANTTQFLGPSTSFSNTTQDIAVEHVSTTNTPQTLKTLPSRSGNATQDIDAVYNEVFTTNTIQVLGIPTLTSADTPQDIMSVHDEVYTINIAQVMGVPFSTNADTSQDIAVDHHGISTVNTTQDMGVASASANTTHDMSTVHHVTVPSIPLVSMASPMPNSIQDIKLTHKADYNSQVIVTIPQSTGSTNLQMASSREVKPPETEVIQALPKDSESVPQGILTVHHVRIEEEAAEKTDNIASASGEKLKLHTSLSSDVSSMHDGNTGGTLVTILEIQSCTLPHTISKDYSAIDRAPSSSADGVGISTQLPDKPREVQDQVRSSKEVFSFKAEVVASASAADKTLSASVKDSQNNSVSHLVSTKEAMLLDGANVMQVDAPEDQMPAADVSPEFVGLRTLGCSSMQCKPDLDQEDKMATNEGNCITGGTVIGSAQIKSSGPQESNGHFLMSESFSMIQAEDNLHDVSVFSASSLSFITSTPVTGLANFQFQKSHADCPLPESNIGCAVEEQGKVASAEPCAITKPMLAGLTGGTGSQKLIVELSVLPPDGQRNMLPPQGSGIPSVRRALVLPSSSTALSQAKDSKLPKTTTGIPLKGVLNNLPRPSLGNPKQNLPGSMASVKLVGSRLKTPRGATAKETPTATPSQLPALSSVGKQPSQLRAPIPRRLSVGVHGAVTKLRDPASEGGAGMRPPPPSGVRSGLPKPRSSTLRPPLPLKQSPKLKSIITGLTVKVQKETSALGLHKDQVSVKGDGISGRRQIKQASSGGPVTVEKSVASRAGGKPTAQTVQETAELSERIQVVEENLDPPVTPHESAKPEICQKSCKFCCAKIEELLRENEDLKKRLGLKTN
ncbi:serine-rich adhesin for platelets-like [Hyperolius riggenbachi]|uniref:serine-rich adhesin for platelets-like n=1 Tax=Hyperolius riggenbachi TaxID=752182 RepID=UPI0035A29CCB